MPPVREASTNPTAATVLPAPVACSNQKRRLAPGSSGASTISSSASASSGSSSQSWGSSSSPRASSSSVAAPLAAPLAAVVPLVPLPAAFEPGFSSSEMIAARVPESASTWCSESSAPSSSSGRSSARTRSSPSSSE